MNDPTNLERCRLCGQMPRPGDDMRPVEGTPYVVHAHHPRGV